MEYKQMTFAENYEKSYFCLYCFAPKINEYGLVNKYCFHKNCQKIFFDNHLKPSINI